MKEAEDTLIKAADIIAKTEAIRLVPATTPAMVEHYQRHLQLNHSDKDLLIMSGFTILGPGLTADPNADPYTVCREGDKDTEFYLLRYLEREAMAYPAGKQQPIGYLAKVLNSVLQPDYELRRFRDKKLGKDGILMPLTPGEWETLTDAYGPMAIEARFSSIHTSTTNPKSS